MRTRTRLTTPPGEEPAPPPSVTSPDGPADDERYVPSFALPEEPRPPSPYRRAVILAVVLVVLVAAGWAILQVVTAGEDFDPAVGDNPSAPAESLSDGGEDDGAATGAGTDQG